MLGRGKQNLYRSALDNPAQIHHRYIVSNVGHYAEIVGDIENAHTQSPLPLTQQIENLAFRGYVERRRRLICN